MQFSKHLTAYYLKVKLKNAVVINIIVSILSPVLKLPLLQIIQM